MTHSELRRAAKNSAGMDKKVVVGLALGLGLRARANPNPDPNPNPNPNPNLNPNPNPNPDQVVKAESELRNIFHELKRREQESGAPSPSP